MIIHRGVVTHVLALSDHLVRVTLGGPDIGRFITTGAGDEYVRVFFPHGDDPTDVSLPVPDGDWWTTPEGAPEAPMRTYTIRATRPSDGELDIDFVLHDDGVAGPWARRAQPGHVLGVNSPAALYQLPPGTRWQFLAADLTGVPAVARIVEQTPPSVHTRVVLEVLDAAEGTLIPSAPNLSLTTLIGGNGHSPSRLGEILRSEVPPSRAIKDGYVWVAGETAALRDARTYLHRERKIPAERFKVVGYWNPPPRRRANARRTGLTTEPEHGAG